MADINLKNAVYFDENKDQGVFRNAAYISAFSF